MSWLEPYKNSYLPFIYHWAATVVYTHTNTLLYTLLPGIIINVCCIIAHRSRPVGQQKNSAIQKSFGTNSSKIILPSSNAEEYIGLFLRSTVSHIANPKGTCVILCLYYRTKCIDNLVGRKGGSFYRNNNCPSWWPKDVAFVPSGIFYSHGR